MTSSLFLALLGVFGGEPNALQAAEDPSDPSRYNITFRSPSKEARDSMPLGNGEVALNAWFEEGENSPNPDLLILLARTDSWGDNSRHLKIGRLRISVVPVQEKDATANDTLKNFKQTLHLIDGTIRAGWGEGNDRVNLRLWIDANRPVVEFNVESVAPSEVLVSNEVWRDKRKTLDPARLNLSDVMFDYKKRKEGHAPTILEPDTILTDLPGGMIGWCHHNIKSVGPEICARVQGVADFKRPDPLLHRTFGAIVAARNAKQVSEKQLLLPENRKHDLSVCVRAEYPSTIKKWKTNTLARIEKDRQAPQSNPKAFRAAHEKWWRDFWHRSWINVTEAGKVRTTSEGLLSNGGKMIVGADHEGSEETKAELPRVTVYNRSLSADEIAQLAKLSPQTRIPEGTALAKGLLGSTSAKGAFDFPNSENWKFPKGFTFEAWIPISDLGSDKRIVGNFMGGARTGMRLDTHSGLRLYMGRKNITARTQDIPKSGRPDFIHVASTFDAASDKLLLYANGESISAVRVTPNYLDTRRDRWESQAFRISRAYTLQRYVIACAGRGNYPIKFNGTLFTVGRSDDPDFRTCGPGFWWQNTRFPYYTMCPSGDFEMMKPLFKMYVTDLLDFWKYRTRRHTGHDGIYIPECVHFWGDCFNECYGWTPYEERGEDKLQQSHSHKYEWLASLELVYLALDLYDHTLDRKVLDEIAFPLAEEAFTFFSQHYKKDANGKLVMYPSQACETCHDTTNPMTEVAGLHALTRRLLDLGIDVTTPQQRARWKTMQRMIPPIPLREADGVTMLAPGEGYPHSGNNESPELYAVFPFRLITSANDAHGWGKAAFYARGARERNDSWSQHSINAAYLGLADEAALLLRYRIRGVAGGCRFPAWYVTSVNAVPDQDNGGTANITLQSMLMQVDGKKIYLLPAWPKNWSVNFRLHAPARTVIDCRYEDGKVQQLDVTPKSRRKDIIIVPETEV